MNLLGFFKSEEWPVVDFEEIKKRSRLLVIDDRAFRYIDLFKRDGYQIDKWNDVDDLGKLEKGFYDILLLDIQGVGTKQSAEQGLGVLRHLREVAPAQIIVAFSDADWSLKYQDFFKMADSALSKGADYVVFKRAVDDLLKKRFSLDFYLSRMNEAVRSAQGNSVGDLNKIARKAILKSNIAILQKYLEKRLDDPEIIKKILAYAGAGIEVIKIAKTLIGQ